MKILVVGSGGREHALVWKLSQNGRVNTLYAAPGNAGIASHAVCIDLGAEDVTGIARFAVSEKIDLVAVGPEVPLCMGIVDILDEAGITVFGPSAKAAMIEGSKVFAKKFMRKYNIPTSEFGNFNKYKDAVVYARSLDADMWIKASGLAAGKGSIYVSNPDEAEKILKKVMIDDMLGNSGHQVVIEQNMKGEEASIFALCDGKIYKLLVSSQDHKRAYDNDTGPNTGGMGAYAPASLVTSDLLDRIEREILQPTLEGMASEGIPYKGLLYAGIMSTEDGPKVVEYNCRFGDPETQVVLPLLEGDLAELMIASAKGDLAKVDFTTLHGFALCVVIASGGYPGTYTKGYVIRGLEEAAMGDCIQVFHAGTVFDGENIVTSGGRVCGVTGWGADFYEARDRAYKAAGCISFQNSFYRKDIGCKALKYIE
ncbi:MAG TPA: phosphoribosylamine--glycine ligase [Anaerolineae bacterium]|nr:phosphoribosylamine--glycine ligase [Anaerolineae bacterium]